MKPQIIIIFTVACLYAQITLAKPKHQCTRNDKVVSCSNRFLSTVPRFVKEKDTESLDMSENEMEELFDADFQGLPNLRYINFNSNTISYIEDNAFEILTELEHVDLSSNLLEDIPEDVFINNKKLKTLDLSGNIFNMQTPLLISDSLEKLDLSFCKITTFNENHVKKLPNLRRLNLNSNNLVVLDVDIFLQLKHFSHVSLRYNTWSCTCDTIVMFDKFIGNNFTTVTDPVSCLKSKTFVHIYDRNGAVSYEQFCGDDVTTESNKPSQEQIFNMPDSVNRIETEDAFSENIMRNLSKNSIGDEQHEEFLLTNNLKMLETILKNEKIYFKDMVEDKNLLGSVVGSTVKMLMAFIFLCGVATGCLVTVIFASRLKKERVQQLLKV